MIDEKTKAEIDRLVKASNGNILLLLAELEKVKSRHPDKIALVEALEAGARQAMGRI